jgi:hypothetical protein
MAARKRPAPSFRPNLELSHFVYDGPEVRHYKVHGKVAKRATGDEDGEVIEVTESPRTGLPFLRRSQREA